MNFGLEPFFSPAGVAIIGASSSPDKLSHGILRNLIQYGYQGKIYPVNPRSKEILGLKCYEEIGLIPDPVDLAVIIIPAQLTANALEDCGKRGIKAVIIISGGFKELGVEGIELEKRCVEIARNYGMRLIGPNCVGTMDLNTGLNTTFIHGMPAKGGIGFVSQSGAVCGGVVDYIRGKGVGFSHFISLGNEADVTETDVIEYLASESHTRVIAAYVEAIQDGKRFVEAVRKVTKQKPVVLLKAGRTSAGAKAVSSHTGSIAGSHAAYAAAFAQAGVIEVKTASELFDVSMALDFQPLPKGNRVAIITNAGGPAALASDSLAENDFTLANLSISTQESLQKYLNPSAQVQNPVDMLGGAEPVEYSVALAKVLEDDEVDVALCILVPQALVDPYEVAVAIGDQAAKTKKTVLTCFFGDESIEPARKYLHLHGVPMYIFPGSVGKVLGAMRFYQNWLQKKPEVSYRLDDVNYQRVNQILSENIGEPAIGEVLTRKIFEAYGISTIPGKFVANSQEACQAMIELGAPVAMKIVSPDILHKSDAGGIKLKLHSKEEIQIAYRELMENAKKYKSDARIQGVLVEKMAGEGIEVIVGVRRDPSFGAVLMFGLGGIYVELFKDVAFRILPVSYDEVVEMVQETKTWKLLRGLRGKEEADIDALVQCILRLGQLALEFNEFDEVEINPLLVLSKGQGVLALDGRAILNQGAEK